MPKYQNCHNVRGGGSIRRAKKFDNTRMRDKLLKYKNIQRLVLKNVQKKQGNEGLYYGETMKPEPPIGYNAGS